MSDPGHNRAPEDRNPLDSWNGARVGALAGAIVGVLLLAVSGSDLYWLALIPAALGGIIGYRSESNGRRSRER